MQTGQRIAIAGMAVSGALAVIKIIAGVMGHSTAVVADGFESAGDVFASGSVLLGLTLAAMPADANHPYGHGRAETLVGLFIGVVLAAGGGLISYRALLKLHSGGPPPASFVVWPLVLSAVVKCGLGIAKLRYGKRILSAALLADAWNDFTDVVSAAAALIAVGLTLSDPERFAAADYFGGCVVGVIVILTGLRVARETVSQLMDTMPDARLLHHIRGAALSVPGVQGVEKCYARKTGLQYHVDLHLEVDPDMTVRESHQIATDVRIRIKESLRWVADVLVHVEPAP